MVDAVTELVYTERTHMKKLKVMLYVSTYYMIGLCSMAELFCVVLHIHSYVCCIEDFFDTLF